MIDIIKARFHQRYRTFKYPDGSPPELPDRFCGLPQIVPDKCRNGCRKCMESCPNGAIEINDDSPEIDLGKCLFCQECSTACENKCISFSSDYRLSTARREDLFAGKKEHNFKLASQLDEKIKKIFGRSLKLRQVSAGGCNACEADINVLTTVGWDLGRFGIQIVASPRHSDGLIITGPVTSNMKLALEKTYEAVADPKIVIAVGACAISGGPYIDHKETYNGAANIVPVDLFIPGCPPHPLTILDGLLRLIGRI